MSGVLLRFAPSPTGYLHAGNARVALLNFLFARQQGGSFWLRLDDTDRERSQKEYEDGIEEDLTWLGLEWDAKIRQSERRSLYDVALERLRAAGKLYPCFETAEELALSRRLQLRASIPPVYDRASLNPERRRVYLSKGRKAHWRFKLESQAVVVHDLVRGESRFDLSRISDPVLVREDGHPLFTLTSVVDDGECGVSHIVRGEDHATNSAVQVSLFESLGYEIPRMAHLPLLRGGKKEEGENSPLSKRGGSLSLRALRKGGMEAKALLLLLARVGTSKTARGDENWEEVVREFSFTEFGRASPVLDMGHLREVNRRVVANMKWQEVWARLADEEQRLLEEEDGELFWRLFRENCDDVGQAGDWVRRGFSEDDTIGRQLPSENIRVAVAKVLDEKKEEVDWVQFVQDIAKEVTLEGRVLYVSLRVGLLGCERGPNIAEVMGLLGKDRVRRRLCGTL